MKIKAPILARIAILFLSALFIASVVVFSFSYNHILRVAEAQSVEVSSAAITAALTAIGSKEHFYDLYDDEEFREQVHKSFRYICKRVALRYLYLYTVDEDGQRHYVICAAESDEDDERIQEEFGFGAVGRSSLYEAEKDVLYNGADEDYEITDNAYGIVCMTVMPIRDGDNNLLALIGADDNMEDVRRIAARNLFNLLLLGLIIFALTFVIALLLIRRSVIRPIQALSNRMRSFVSDRKENVEAAKRKSIYEDEISDIENAYEKMSEDINQYVTDIEALTRRQVYTQTQLEVASKIQNGIVPGEYFLPGDQFNVYGCLQTAREVGGDFYDVFRMDDGRTCVLIGDVSGKGISAALFMSMVKTTIKEKLMAGRGLADTLNLVNQELCASNPEGMFATVFAMAVHPETGIVTYANAGHEEPLLLGEEPSYLDVMSGIALGLFEDSDIVEEKLVLRGGEGLLLYTDGFTEAINTEKQQYGKERLRDTASGEYRKGIAACDVRAMVSGIVASVRSFASGMEQFDDMTCLALIYKDPGARKTVLDPDLKSFQTIKSIILASIGESDHAKNIILACEEIFVNIVSYSGADQVAFSSKRCGNVLVLTYEDNGIPFDPVKAEREKGELEDLDRGGMGILIARRNSKDIIYNRIGNRNVLTMVFDTANL